ncbi:MAG: CPBP family intramembrane metalloprotease [Sandaracinaceae bacterium]|nr:CPBP family intramembrane metalloprotease [Sandaracinaceae bacterium]
MIAEEIVWRSVVQDALVNRIGLRWGVVVAAVLYAVSLAPLGSPVLILVALLCGLTWSVLRATTASLLAPIVAHLVWDLMVLFLVPLDAA